MEEFGGKNVKLTSAKTYFLQTTFEGLGNLTQHAKHNRDYMLSLTSDNLLRNHYMEAGMWTSNSKPEGIHWGWESPSSQMRGHFLGHWLSAAAQMYEAAGDSEIKGKADYIVSELAKCQRRNGGEWVFGIPEKLLSLIARGEIVWAPQYNIHKTLMGLWDMYYYAGNAQALDIFKNAANWFHRWAGSFTREQFNNILDFETGGMLEIWANLYGETKDAKHLELINMYDRPRLFDPIVKGEDVLTNYHANTTIPEVLGAARAWEVTGDIRWRKITENYWDLAVTKRGYYVTGGQTSGEAWTPKNTLAPRLGTSNQEHCVVYNMMRLAGILYRWTGDKIYADYWERNYYNGLLAQEHPKTGMVAYYLPMKAGQVKKWGHPTEDFWCCHGTLVQAIPSIHRNIYYRSKDGITVSQYIPSSLNAPVNGSSIRLAQNFHTTPAPVNRPGFYEKNPALHCGVFTINKSSVYALSGFVTR